MPNIPASTEAQRDTSDGSCLKTICRILRDLGITIGFFVLMILMSALWACCACGVIFHFALKPFWIAAFWLATLATRLGKAVSRWSFHLLLLVLALLVAGVRSAGLIVACCAISALSNSCLIYAIRVLIEIDLQLARVRDVHLTADEGLLRNFPKKLVLLPTADTSLPYRLWAAVFGFALWKSLWGAVAFEGMILVKVWVVAPLKWQEGGDIIMQVYFQTAMMTIGREMLKLAAKMWVEMSSWLCTGQPANYGIIQREELVDPLVPLTPTESDTSSCTDLEADAVSGSQVS